MGINLQSLKYMAQGFKKVALNDTKGVLTKKNNFKWVKEGPGYTMETIFPTGTRVRENCRFLVRSENKVITKPNGTVITQAGFGNALRITKTSKNGTDLDCLVRKDLAQEPAQELTEKRFNFIY